MQLRGKCCTACAASFCVDAFATATTPSCQTCRTQHLRCTSESTCSEHSHLPRLAVRGHGCAASAAAQRLASVKSHAVVVTGFCAHGKANKMPEPTNLASAWGACTSANIILQHCAVRLGYTYLCYRMSSTAVEKHCKQLYSCWGHLSGKVSWLASNQNDLSIYAALKGRHMHTHISYHASRHPKHKTFMSTPMHACLLSCHTCSYQQRREHRTQLQPSHCKLQYFLHSPRCRVDCTGRGVEAIMTMLGYVSKFPGQHVAC